MPAGAQGSLARHSYIVDGRAIVEIARVAGRHDRREYHLRDESSQPALLVNALSGGSKEWHLFVPTPVPPGLTPHEAAAKRKGTPVGIEGRTLRITDLFQSKALSADGPAANNALPGAVRYGFIAADGGEWLIARWNETQIEYLRGSAVAESEVIAALGTPPEKTK